MALGEALRLQRERCDLTQVELARHVGVRQQTVSRWEADLALPPPRRVLVLDTTDVGAEPPRSDES